MCINRGGGNVGVKGGQGAAPLKKWSLTGKVFAQEPTIQPGRYEITGINVDVTTLKLDVFTEGKVRYFYDSDENGMYDEGEEFLSDEEAETIEITLNKQTDVVTYSIDEGWNAIAVPLIMQGEDSSNVETASELAKYMIASDLDVVHISAYRSQKFMIYTLRSDTDGELREFGQDFGLIPGEGYFVKSDSSGEFSLAGVLPAEVIPTPVYTGWNLVGFYHPDTKLYSSFDVLDQMNSQNIPAEILSKWEGSKYSSSILDGEEYGLDFELYRS